ncbi:MAG: endonuclease domain-containing protein [Sphingomonadales bacterium]
MVVTVRNLKPVARRLRREMTGVERKLWSKLRDRRLDGLKFRRQEPCEGYIADFLCENPRLIVEIDGYQHSEEVDATRTRRLER